MFNLRQDILDFIENRSSGKVMIESYCFSGIEVSRLELAALKSRVGSDFILLIYEDSHYVLKSMTEDVAIHFIHEEIKQSQMFCYVSFSNEYRESKFFKTQEEETTFFSFSHKEQIKQFVYFHQDPKQRKILRAVLPI